MQLDVFPIAGQSNAEGRGDSSKSPTVGTDNAYEYDGTSLVQLDDPVGDAETGGAWPQFAISYYQRRGVPSVYQEDATGASRMTVDGTNGSNGNWNPAENSLYPPAVTDMQDMMTYLENNGHDATMRGILWWQGESDAQNIDEGSVTQTQYEDNTRAMIDAFRSDLSRPDLPFFIVEIGHQTSDGGTGDTAGYKAVRESQRNICIDKMNTYLVSDLSKDLIDDGFVSPSHGGTHHDQEGYDFVGELAGTTVYNQLFAPKARFKRGTDNLTDNYIGRRGELTVNTTTNRIHVHDGVTSGGHQVALGSDIGSGTSSTADYSTLVDSFEDNNIGEYAGDTANYSVVKTPSYHETYALEAPGKGYGIGSTTGLDAYPGTGDTFRVYTRQPTDGRCLFTWFAQSEGATPDGYEVFFDVDNSILALRVRSGGSVTTLESASVTFDTADYISAEITHTTGNDITVEYFDAAGSSQLQLPTNNDTSFTSGGIAFLSNTDSTNNSVYWDYVGIV